MTGQDDPIDGDDDIPGELARERRGIKSVETGNRLLLTLSAADQPMTLSEIAAALKVSATKVHPYMVSFMRQDFVLQNQSGRYELGPSALQIGLARMRRLDPVQIAIEEIASLAETVTHAIAISIEGNLGPTVVWFEESRVPLYVYLKPGTVMSLLHTATGRAFAAYMPAKRVETMLAIDATRFGGHMNRPGPVSRQEIETILAEVRTHGIARELVLVPGVKGMSVPAFDAQGRVVLAVTVTGPADGFDADWDGATARALKTTAARISNRLGFRNP